MDDTNKRKVIAGRLREARRLSGLSQGQVAQMMNLHRPSVSEVEAGNRRVSAEELTRFAEIYEVSVGYLTGNAPDSLGLDDPHLEMAARELQKLSPESLDKLLRALAALRTADEKGRA